MRLICQLCEGRLVTGHDAINVHITMHRLLDEPCQAWWAVPGGLVLKPAPRQRQ